MAGASISASSFLTVDGVSTEAEVPLNTAIAGGAKHGAWSTLDVASTDYFIEVSNRGCGEQGALGVPYTNRHKER